MASNYWNKRRSSEGARAGAVGYMAAQGRAPSFDSEGNVRGFRSKPGATSSPRDTANIGIPSNFGGGLTPDSQWNAFFDKTPRGGTSEPIIPDPDMSAVPGNPEAFSPVQFGLAADVPQDSEAMAADLGDFQYQGEVPPVGEMTADDYLDAAIGENEEWFGGRPFAPEGGVSFTSKYGSGFSRNGPSYSDRLKRLAGESIYDL